MPGELTKGEERRQAIQIKMDEEYFALPYVYRQKVSFDTFFNINGGL